MGTTVSIQEKVKALYWEMRPLNSITAAIAVVVAMHLAFGINEPDVNPITFFFVAGAAFCVTAHSMVHNDIVDYEIDKINAPHRALPSGTISMKTAKIWAVVLAVLAILFGLLIDLQIGVFPFSIFWAILNMTILDIYNLKLKQSGLFGNLIIGYVVSALFLYADIVVNHALTIRTESIGLYAFFVIWGREVLKDVMDIEGDRQHGMRTIPVRLGAKTGAIVGSAIIGVGILSSLPLIIYPLDNLVVPIVLSIIDVIIIYLCIRVINTPEKEVIYKSKLWMLRLLLIALVILAISQFLTIYL